MFTTTCSFSIKLGSGTMDYGAIKTHTLSLGNKNVEHNTDRLFRRCHLINVKRSLLFDKFGQKIYYVNYENRFTLKLIRAKINPRETSSL